MDMLAGLSMLYILRMPPRFWADAVPPPDIEISNTPAARHGVQIAHHRP
jgi:hypothetical protein